MLPAKRFATSGPKRPVNKIVFINTETIGAAQTNSSIYSSTVAETFSGGHITGSLSSSASAGTVIIALVVVPSSVAVPTLSVTDNTLIEPEQYILWIGCFSLLANTVGSFYPINAKIKAMRKMKPGDDLYVCTLGSGATTGVFSAAITVFFKE